MGGSFFIGLSGLSANSQGLRTVGNNLANANSIGYKTSNLFFEELRASMSGSLQTGQGVVPAKSQQVWSQGNIQQSQLSTDMAIQGAGFFVVGDGVNAQFFTRAGNFVVNNEGKLVTSDGLFVLGYPAVGGSINTNTVLQPLDVTPGKILSAEPTTLIRFTTNLNSESAINDTFSTSVVVNDSLGASHVITVTLTKVNTGEWDYSMTVPAQDVGGAPSDPPVEISNGTLTFDATGQLTSPPAGDPSVTGITITGLINGANDIQFDWVLYSANGGSFITQLKLPSFTSDTFQNGNSSGTLTSFVVTQDGTIQGLFSNGETSPLGQVAVAYFVNPQGLLSAGGNLYNATTESGQPTIGVAGTGGRGTIQGGALEMSNVDIAEEFIKLIIFQRGYQANSRVITTSDQITLEALQLKQ